MQKSEKKGQEWLVNLSKSSLAELNDLLDRQNKLLKNTKFINNLPDRGERIRSFHSKILEKIKSRDKVDEASELLSKMNLNNLPSEIEWSGKEDSRKEPKSADQNGDESNPLRILANHSGTIKATQKSSKSSEEAGKECLPYAEQICQKYGEKTALPRFKPNQPKNQDLAKTGFKASSENVQKMMGKHWEVTSATPPVPICGSTSEISLSDSLLLQQQQASRLKEIQIQEAIARLQNASTKMGPLPTANSMKYRNPVDLFDETPVREQKDAENENLDEL